MQPESMLILERRSERRTKARYPLRLGVRYRTLSSGPALVGVGRTVNMSSGGLLIASEKAKVAEGARLQLTVEWPFLLHGVTPLQLVASCRVTRCDPEEFAVKMDQYLFRTTKR
jgi:PilZ domain